LDLGKTTNFIETPPKKSINMEFETIQVLHVSTFTETRLVRLKGVKDGFDDKKAILKIVKKSKFHKREKTINMSYVKDLVIVDHPNLMKLMNFSMSANYFYYLTEYADLRPNQKALPLFECLIKQ
jgi:hypothetical protein